MMKARLCILLPALLALASCNDSEEITDAASPPVRGLKTIAVSANSISTQRRYPGVLEPNEVNQLSFKVSGRLKDLNLSVGQTVKKGDLLAELDGQQFTTAIENQEAAVEEAQANAKQAKDDLDRKNKLIKRGATTRVSVDDAEINYRTSQAKLVQAQKNLASAQEDMSDTQLRALFDGVISSVDAESFSTVSAGTPIASIYKADNYEVSFSVNFDTVRKLKVGTPARIWLADDASVSLNATVSELGERANSVSSFPVVVKLVEENPLIRAGMAVEVSLDFKVETEKGYLLPLSASIRNTKFPKGATPRKGGEVPVFVYDPQTSTVKERIVTMAGIRENYFLVVSGLEEGERVATAGVTFLHDGMKVELLEEGK